MEGGPTLLHLHSGLTAQSVTNGVMWTSIHASPILRWSSHCRSNATTTWDILGNYALTLGNAHGGLAIRSRVGEAKLPLEWWVIFMMSWISTGYFSNSTSSSVTGCQFSAFMGLPYQTYMCWDEIGLCGHKSLYIFWVQLKTRPIERNYLKEKNNRHFDFL